tara:strand:- start:431 stop:835 length:405 start_codon:yes stop_codon:yes gene_type:complete
MYIYDMKIFRRIIAIFLIFSTASGVIDELTEYGNLTDGAVGGVIITIVIVYFLLRNPKKKIEKTKIRNKDSEIVEDIEDLEIETTEVRSENDKSNTFSRKSKNIISPSTSSYSPINDKESLITRLFKGKTDRIG